MQTHYDFNEDQQDLFDVIISELERDPIRKVVVQNQLKPFLTSFEGGIIYSTGTIVYRCDLDLFKGKLITELKLKIYLN